jgi:hypothetical protein
MTHLGGLGGTFLGQQCCGVEIYDNDASFSIDYYTPRLLFSNGACERAVKNENSFGGSSERKSY